MEQLNILQRWHGSRHFDSRNYAQLLTHLGKNIELETVGKYREGDIRHCVADISHARTAWLRAACDFGVGNSRADRMGEGAAS